MSVSSRDTHLPRFGHALPAALRDGFRDAGVAHILHLGDHVGPEVPALFEAIAPYDAVAGNNDGPELVQRFGRRRVVELDGVRIGLTHGDQGLAPTTREKAMATFSAHEVAVVLFGHSHAPHLEWLADGRLLLNPGSPTDKRLQPRYSWALLSIDGGAVTAEHRFFDDRSI